MLAWSPAASVRRLRLLTFYALVVTALVGPACHDTTGPTKLVTPAPSYVIVSGNSQTGPVGAELPLALVAKATDGSGTAIAGITLFFVVTQGNGRLYAGGGVTNSGGQVEDYWTLGPGVGTQKVEVRAVDPTTGTKNSYATFTATAVAGAAAIIKMSAGDGQTAFTRALLPIKPAALVTDAFGNPVAGVSITFTVTAGGGTAFGSPATTNASGIAAMTNWRMGFPPGTNKVTANKTGLTGSPVTFTATSRFGLATVVEGAYHSCALDAANDVYCWGFNGVGDFGDGTNINRYAPVRVSGAGLPTSLAVGYDHTCVLVSGKAKCAGWNFYGNLGDGTTNSESHVYVAVAGTQTFTSLTSGANTTCGITTAGSVYCWGANGNGEFGNGGNTGSNVPLLSAGGLTLKSVFRGANHTCGLTASGTAWCWGYNSSGQLGNTSTTNSLSPVLVSGGLVFASLELGASHTCGLTPTGTAYCWGFNTYGTVGNSGNTNVTSPVPVVGGITFRQLAAGNLQTCGITPAGVAYCWGDNSSGQLGVGATGSTPSYVPTPVAGGHVFSSISSGEGDNTCGVPLGGGLPFCWGTNYYGMLGNGTTIPSPVPVEVLTPPIP